MNQIVVLLLIIFSSLSWGKITYFNLENTYGPYCNPKNKFTPDAGIVRYAGTPWVGLCVLNLESCCLPTHPNGTLIANLPTSTRFYLYLMVPPLCDMENITVHADSGETIVIDCLTKNGSEYYFDTENLQIVYHRSAKMPISKFSMIVTPMKMKTRMYSTCGFDCFSDTHCIHNSLVCDRYRNCPNNVDEANCEYSHQHEPLSFYSKVILSCILLATMSMAISSIFICYFCCSISQRHRQNSMNKDRKISHATLEEGNSVLKPLLS